MRFPKEIKTYCPFCESHTVHELKEVKKHKPGELTWGQRQFRRVLKGYRGYPRPLPHHEKPTKRKDVRVWCKTCKKGHGRKAIRSKKYQIGR